jgi:hypothetical protein
MHAERPVERRDLSLNKASGALPFVLMLRLEDIAYSESHAKTIDVCKRSTDWSSLDLVIKGEDHEDDDEEEG